MTDKIHSVYNGQAIPPIHFACADDSMRPVLEHVYLTREHIVATNSSIVVVHKTEEVFSEEFIEGFPDEPFLIYRTFWAEMSSNKVSYLIWENGNIVINYRKKAPDGLVRPVVDGGDEGKYPNWQAVIPDDDRTVLGLTEIGLNPDYLVLTQKAFGLPKNSGLYFSFDESNTATIITHDIEGVWPSAKAIIMPLVPKKVKGK